MSKCKKGETKSLDETANNSEKGQAKSDKCELQQRISAVTNIIITKDDCGNTPSLDLSNFPAFQTLISNR